MDIVKENLNIGDVVRLKGNIKNSKFDPTKIIIDLSYFYKLNDESLFEKKMNSHMKLEKILKLSKNITKLEKIKSMPYVEHIKNIALINFTSADMNFSNQFSMGCKGELFIFRMKENC